MVTGQQQSLPDPIPQRKGEHTLQVLDAIVAMFFVKMQYDFDISAGAKPMALLNQCFVQCRAVINLPIAHQHQGVVLVTDGLVAGLKIDNAEPGLAQSNFSVVVVTLIIRPTVMQRPRHPLNGGSMLRVRTQYSGNAAHLKINQ
jgi:hypothetical protein